MASTPPSTAQTLSAQPFVAQTPEQARLLIDLLSLPLLNELIKGPRSASEVAAAAEVDLKRAHHRLTRLLGAGLIEVCGHRQRGGRPVKMYRAVAEVYRVPFALSDTATVQELLFSMFMPFVRHQSGEMGRKLWREGHQDIVLQLDQHDFLSVGFGDLGKVLGAREMYGAFSGLRLTPASQRELQRRLADLGQWAAQQTVTDRHRPDATDCLLGLTLTPGNLNS